MSTRSQNEKYRLSLSSLKRALSSRRRNSKCKTAPTNINTLGTEQPLSDSLSVDLPAVVWMDHVFPFLDRTGQDCLAQAQREVALARRSSFHQQRIQWPCGRLQKLPRPVKKVTFSPNDSTLLVACCKKTVLQYDKLRGPRLPITGHTGVVADVQFSSAGDTQVLATAGKKDGMIRLWKLKNNEREGTNTNPEYECFRILEIYQHDLRHITWSPRGDRIASWGQDGFVRVSNCHNGALRSKHWKTRLEVSGCHETVAFEPPFGTTLAFARNNDLVYLWNLETDSIRTLPDFHDDHGSYAGAYVTSLAYSPDGRYFAVGCHVALIKFWSVVSTPSRLDEGELDDNHTHDSDYIYTKQIFVGGEWSAVTLLSFTSDGRFLACSNDGSQIRIVDTEANRVLTTLKGHTARIESLSFTSDGRRLASGACDRTVRLWNTSPLCSDH